MFIIFCTQWSSQFWKRLCCNWVNLYTHQSLTRNFTPIKETDYVFSYTCVVYLEHVCILVRLNLGCVMRSLACSSTIRMRTEYKAYKTHPGVTCVVNQLWSCYCVKKLRHSAWVWHKYWEFEGWVLWTGDMMFLRHNFSKRWTADRKLTNESSRSTIQVMP